MTTPTLGHVNELVVHDDAVVVAVSKAALAAVCGYTAYVEIKQLLAEPEFATRMSA